MEFAEFVKFFDEISVPFVFGFLVFSIVAAIVIVALVLHHRQRMAIIEKAIMPKPPEMHLRRGLILAFLGGGILAFFSIAIFTGFHFPYETNQAVVFVGIILLAIGIAEIMYYRLTRPKAAPPTEKETAEPQRPKAAPPTEKETPGPQRPKALSPAEKEILESQRPKAVLPVEKKTAEPQRPEEGQKSQS